MLESLGLSDLMQSVYLAVLRQPDIGVTDVSAELGVDEQTVRCTLDQLAHLELVRLRWEEPREFRAVSPELGLTALLEREQEKLAQRNHEIARSRAAVAQLLINHAEIKANSNDPAVERLIGLDAIRGRLEELAVSCRTEALSFMPGGAQSPEGLRASRVLDEAAVARGVKIRTVYLDSMFNDARTTAYALWLQELGSEVRTTPVLPVRMLIVDREHAVVPIDSDRSNAGAVVLSGAGLVEALVSLFYFVWEISTPLGVSRVSDDSGLSSQEKQVLRLLASGYTDEAMARKLGVSVRTVRRNTADLLQQLGARSRFQAGVLAAERGWITDADLA
ncbi:helix-turn-helix transcriptional regulator [Catellatospora methionotrophica]|nr:LuxR family transcriptional regulator [Catellatospora methionotrophica]